MTPQVRHRAMNSEAVQAGCRSGGCAADVGTVAMTGSCLDICGRERRVCHDSRLPGLRSWAGTRGLRKSLTVTYRMRRNRELARRAGHDPVCARQAPRNRGRGDRASGHPGEVFGKRSGRRRISQMPVKTAALEANQLTDEGPVEYRALVGGLVGLGAGEEKKRPGICAPAGPQQAQASAAGVRAQPTSVRPLSRRSRLYGAAGLACNARQRAGGARDQQLRRAQDVARAAAPGAPSLS